MLSDALVVLDSTVLVADLNRRSKPLETLVREALRQGYRLVVPEVVVREVVNHYRERLSEGVEAIEVQLGVWKKKLGYVPPVATSELWADSVQEAEKFEGSLREWLQSNRISVLPIPDVSHSDLISRDLRRHKPFDSEGKGYRDALIWHNVLEAVRFGNNVVLITNNQKDFWNERSHLGLAGTLRSDVDDARSLVGSGSVQLAKDADAFIKRFVGPVASIQHELRQRLRSDEEFRQGIFDGIAEYLLDEVELDRDHYPDEEPSFLYARVESVRAISDLDIASVKHSGPNTYLVRMEAKCDVVLDWVLQDEDGDQVGTSVNDSIRWWFLAWYVPGEPTLTDVSF